MKNDRPYTRPVRDGDARKMLPNIPPEDRMDMMNGWGMDCEAALTLALEKSAEAYSIVRGEGTGEEILGMFGIKGDGQMWLMRAGAMNSAAIPFIRRSGEFFTRWLEKYGTIFCYFSEKYKMLTSFLLWSGFDLEAVGGGYWRFWRCARR